MSDDTKRHNEEKTASIPKADTLTPADRYQELFIAVQMGRVFSDSKTFVDCVPRGDPEDILEAYRVDVETRTNPDGNQRTFPEGHGVNAHEIGPGVVYKDAKVMVTAFPTKHAMESYGYRFETPDRTIVISGDTNPAPATIDACKGCDVLIHEGQSPAWLAGRPDTFQRFAAKYHTTTPQLAELAQAAKPRLLVVYHYSSVAPEEILGEMLRLYPGHVVVGRDLDIY